MKRHYENVESADKVTYFVGPEVEHTIMWGKPTLFKVGEQSLNEILEFHAKGEKKLSQQIDHIYFTANHSLTQIQDWNILGELLNMGFYVTVDGFSEDIRVVEKYFPDNDKLIVIISIPILEAEKRKNTYIKIDIEEFGVGNPGVWCVPLKNITHFQDVNCFTDWSEYKKDIILS